MKYDFVKFELTHSQKLWLEELYSAYKNDRHADPSHIKRKLWKKLDPDFDPYDIDRSLACGNHISPLGIWHIDPDTDILNRMDRLLQTLRELLIEKYDVNEIKVEDLASKSGLGNDEILKIVKSMAPFSRSNGLRQIQFNKSKDELTIDVASFELVDKLLKYKDLETFIKDEFLSAGKPNDIRNVTSTPLNAFFRQSSITSSHESNTAFILMWMADESNPQLQDAANAMKEVFNRFDIVATRADDIQHQDSITKVILQKIRSSEFLVADLTGGRPNVYYEVGYAHAIDKRPILLRKKGTSLHFDLADHNVPEYKNITELKELLHNRLESMLGKRIETGA